MGLFAHVYTLGIVGVLREQQQVQVQGLSKLLGRVATATAHWVCCSGAGWVNEHVSLSLILAQELSIPA